MTDSSLSEGVQVFKIAEPARKIFEIFATSHPFQIEFLDTSMKFDYFLNSMIFPCIDIFLNIFHSLWETYCTCKSIWVKF